MGKIATACLLVLIGCPANSQVQFEDRTASLPVRHVYSGGWEHFVGGGVALMDCNDDGFTDMFAAGGLSPSTLFVNRSETGGTIAFTEAAIDPLINATGAYPIDFNNDTLVDLFVLRNGQNRLLLGDGTCEFAEASKVYGLPDDNRWSTAFSATWENGLDLPTLAIGNYVDTTDPDGPFGTCDTNFLLRPQDDRYVSQELLPSFCPLSILFSDWQRTGTPLLRLSNDRHYYVEDGYEQMWMLDPLRELTAQDGWDQLQLWGMGIASGDVTGDGLPDVMLTSMGDQVLMANTGISFDIVPYSTGSFAQRPFVGGDGRPSTGWHAEFGDLNNDGRPDLFIAKGNVDQMPDMAMQDPNNLLIQQEGGTFIEAAETAGILSFERGRGGGLADLNNDGRLDLVVVNRRAPLELWQNVTEEPGNWLGLSLSQLGANTNAIGAYIEVETDAGLQTREVTIGGGHVSGKLTPHHFGIGQAEVARVRVVWPDGKTSTWRNVTANGFFTVHRETDND